MFPKTRGLSPQVTKNSNKLCEPTLWLLDKQMCQDSKVSCIHGLEKLVRSSKKIASTKTAILGQVIKIKLWSS